MMSRPLSVAQASALRQAFGQLRAGETRKALAIAQQLAGEAPDAPDAMHLLAMCLAQTGMPDEADAAFRRALQLAPAHPLILANQAAMWRTAGDPARALPLAEQLVQASSQSAKAWLDLASTAHASGAHGRAIEAAKRALELQPDSADAWQLLGKVARASVDLETAAEAFTKVSELDPGRLSAHVALGAVLRMAGRPDAAVGSLEAAMRRLGRSAPLADALAGALLDAGRTDEAIACSEQVVGEFPDFAPALTTLASLLWEYAPAERAAEDPSDLFHHAIAQRPQEHERRIAYAGFLLTTRAAEAALEQIRWLREREDQPRFILMEAQALDMLGQTQPARTLFARLHRDIGARSLLLLNAYARHLLRSGEPEQAGRIAESATQAAPDSQEAWAYLATAWRLLEDPREFWLCDYERLIGAVEIEPPAGFADCDAFLDALAEELEPLHRARREPMQQSLRGGSQTPGRLFGRPSAVIRATRQAMLRGVERWLATLPADSSHPFLRRNLGYVRIGGSWSVKLRSSGRHVNHFHSEGWMSSAFYVSLPPSVSAGPDRAGAIQFGQPPVELGLDLPSRRMIRPRAGTLMLFPSYLWHGTVPFEDTVPRLTIAFDMTPTGR